MWHGTFHGHSWQNECWSSTWSGNKIRIIVCLGFQAECSFCAIRFRDSVSVSNVWFDSVVCSFSYVINKIKPSYGCNKNITVFSKKKNVYLVESGNKMHVWRYKLLMFLGNCLKKINWFLWLSQCHCMTVFMSKTQSIRIGYLSHESRAVTFGSLWSFCVFLDTSWFFRYGIIGVGVRVYVCVGERVWVCVCVLFDLFRNTHV
jgi:hypothetical protein